MRRHRSNEMWIAGIVVATLLALTTTAWGKSFGPWGPAVNAEELPGTSSDLNTPYLDGCPIPSPNGLSLYVASNRPGGQGGLDIWVSHRQSVSAPWGTPENLGAPVNSGADDFCPTPVRGKGLFFVSSRAGHCGGPDIFFARRNPRHGWTAPSNLGCHVNSPAGEAGPSFFEADGEIALYFSSSRVGGFSSDHASPPDSDIYVAPLLADGSFGAAVPAAGLNTASEDARPNVRKDGLEIVFDSNRPGTLGGPDVYSATRAAVGEEWDAPENLGSAVNTSSSETRPSLSWDATTLFFGSNRAGSELAPDGATRSNDIYVSTRED